MKFSNILEMFSEWKNSPVICRTPLELAIENAMLLVSTAAEKAISIDEQSIAAIIATRNKKQTDQIDEITERDFWIAYTDICAELLPITIDSIKANFLIPRRKKFGILGLKTLPLSQQCARSYKILSSIVLFSLIVVQIYWYIGFALVTDINTQSTNIQTLDETIEKTEILALEQPNTDKIGNDLRTKNHQNRLHVQLKEHHNWKIAAATHLQNWNEVWSSLDLLTEQPWQRDAFTNLTIEVQQRIQFVSAENVLQAISTYFLPILYGLIGACFYILRQLPKEIKNLTFSRTSYTNYSLRLAQGPLAGILISYFMAPVGPSPKANPENIGSLLTIDPGISSLSPLALAFLAGYSVEFIFKILDKILTLPISEGEPINQNTPTHRCCIKPKSLNQKENA